MPNKSNIYIPSDDMGLQLLTSIPKKFVVWMANLDFLSPKGQLGVLEWKIKKNMGESMLLLDDTDTVDTFGPVQIFWHGGFKAEKIRLVRGTEKWFENIPLNLDKFVLLEKKIYDELQQLDDDIRREADAEAERNFQTLQADRVLDTAARDSA